MEYLSARVRFWLVVLALLLPNCGQSGGGGAPADDGGPDPSAEDAITLSAPAVEPGDSPTSYSWRQQRDGGPEVELEDPRSANPFFRRPQVDQETTLVFIVEVTVDEATFEFDVEVTVQPADGAVGGEPANHAPLADAGPFQAVEVGDTVTLNARGSSDPDGDDLRFVWTQTQASGVDHSGRGHCDRIVCGRRGRHVLFRRGRLRRTGCRPGHHQRPGRVRRRRRIR